MLLQNFIIISTIALLFMVSSGKVKCQFAPRQYIDDEYTQIDDESNTNFKSDTNKEESNGMPFLIKDLRAYLQLENDPKNKKQEIRNCSIAGNSSQVTNENINNQTLTVASNQQSKPITKISPEKTSVKDKMFGNMGNKTEDGNVHDLKKLVQQLYVAQAQVQLEATEIQRAQSVASSAQQALEEMTKNVRVILATLHSAQEAIAKQAIRAHTAQLQLAAHDQLLFTARQKVDSLSAQVVALQAEESIAEHKVTVDIPSLLKKLQEPLPQNEKPTPVPSILVNENGVNSDQFTGYTIENRPFKNRRSEKFVRNNNKIGNNVQLLPNLNENVSFINERANVPVHYSNPKQSTDINVSENLTEKDFRDLLDLIISTKPEDKSWKLVNDKNIKPENQKYLNNFLKKIEDMKPGIEIRGRENQSSINNLKNSKLSDRILSLYETILKSKAAKRESSTLHHETTKTSKGDRSKRDYDENSDYSQ